MIRPNIIGTIAVVMLWSACEDDHDAAHGSDAASTQSNAPADSHAVAGAQSAAPASPDAVLAQLPEEMRPSELMPAFASKVVIPDLANNAIAAFTDVETVGPGQDITFCTYTPIVTKDVMYVHDSKGLQSQFGHHAILQYTTTPQAPGTHECKSDSLEAQQSQVITGQSNEAGGGVVFNDNVVSEIPAGAQILINHHWINTSDEPADVQAEVVTIPPKASATDLIIARSFLVLSTKFNIDAHQNGEKSVECALDHGINLVTASGHEHEWGTHVKGELMGDAAGVLFDDNYTPDNVTHPHIQYFPADEPYRLNSGDHVKMTCQWNNTTDHALSFPSEMCVLFGWQIGAEHDAECMDGTWLQ